ncbi:MAG: HlyD family efflux transporter periplasmic adaptor subunit, partial [Oligoflexia bacterium]|nr:HlyD family efflux transporter periplasmic adaptor subunit [Oligoflexia bacterium]
RLRSPIDGVLLRLGVRLGETVDPASNTPLAEIVDPSIIELVGQVPVADITRLKKGQAASISVSGSAPLPATVVAVPPGVDAATGLGTVRVRLAEGQRLPVGAMAVATVQIGQRTGIVTVPETAIRGAAEGGQEVVACVDGHAKTIPVIPGATQDHRVEVRATGGEALDSTILVVVEGSLALQDGAALAVRP